MAAEGCPSLRYSAPGFYTNHTLLPNLNTPSDYSVSDNGFTRQVALKNNSMCQGVLMSVHGWKWLPEWITEKKRKNPLGSTEVYNPLDKCIRDQGCFSGATTGNWKESPRWRYYLSSKSHQPFIHTEYQEEQSKLFWDNSFACISDHYCERQ
jgi:hypothetical protein